MGNVSGQTHTRLPTEESLPAPSSSEIELTGFTETNAYPVRRDSRGCLGHYFAMLIVCGSSTCCCSWHRIQLVTIDTRDSSGACN